MISLVGERERRGEESSLHFTTGKKEEEKEKGERKWGGGGGGGSVVTLDSPTTQSVIIGIISSGGKWSFGGWRRNARIENRRYTACVSRRGCLLLLEISGS